MCARSVLETRDGRASWIVLALALDAAKAKRKFLGGLLRGAWHISHAVKRSLSQARIDMTREARSAMGSIPMGVGRLSTT